MKTILINNKFVAEKDAKVSILGSLGRGYGVFETLRTNKEKKILQTKEHIDRLFSSAKKIDLKIKYNKTQLIKMLEKVTKKSSRKIQRIKIMAIEEGIIIFSVPLKIDKKIYEGVSCISVECRRSLPEVKSISYLPSFLSHEKAIKKGCYDAILIDEKDEVYEGAYSNIFWFEGDILCTREKDILPGITRQTILKKSPFKTKFAKITLKNLLKKSEIFLTTSVAGIVPVTKIDNKKIGNGKVGEKTKKMMLIFNLF